MRVIVLFVKTRETCIFLYHLLARENLCMARIISR